MESVDTHIHTHTQPETHHTHTHTEWLLQCGSCYGLVLIFQMPNMGYFQLIEYVANKEFNADTYIFGPIFVLSVFLFIFILFTVVVSCLQQQQSTWSTCHPIF